MNKFTFLLPILLDFSALPGKSQGFRIGPEGYFRNEGVDVMAFYDFYPEGTRAVSASS